MSMENLLAKLDKYHGKPNEVEIENDDGEIDKWLIYPLPNKYLPLMLKIQQVIQRAPTKQVDGKEVPDTSALKEEDQEKLADLNRELVVTSIAFSMCVQEGLLDYKTFDKGVPERKIESVKQAVNGMNAAYFQKFMEGIGAANETPVTGDSKNEEVSQLKNSNEKLE